MRPLFSSLAIWSVILALAGGEFSAAQQLATAAHGSGTRGAKSDPGGNSSSTWTAELGVPLPWLHRTPEQRPGDAEGVTGYSSVLLSLPYGEQPGRTSLATALTTTCLPIPAPPLHLRI